MRMLFAAGGDKPDYAPVSLPIPKLSAALQASVAPTPAAAAEGEEAKQPVGQADAPTTP